MAILIERNVPCEMRDGTTLRADVYRDPVAGPAPVLVFRTPYNKSLPAITNMALDPVRAVEAGYVVVLQDTRGRFASDGLHTPWLDEFEDGFDTVEWAARQPWSNGRVGTYGISYHGTTAWASAVMAPPSLCATAPTQAPCDVYDLFWRQGAYELGLHTQWALRVMGPTELLRARRERPAIERMREFAALVDELDMYESMVRTLPLTAMPPIAAHDPYFPFITDILDHPSRDDFYALRSITARHGAVRVPAMITASWHDPMLRADLAHFAAIKEHGATAAAREQSRLVIGPWVHGPGMHMSAGGEVDYGYRASGLSLDLKEDLTQFHLRWFDRWLMDRESPPESPVRIFVMGINRWRDEPEWPLKRARGTNWHLHADRTLSPVSPTVDAPPLVYDFDPQNPLPTIGGATQMPAIYSKGSVAQNVLHGRADVLLFTSAPLGAPLEVTGPVRVRLWASSSAEDADWVVKLCDVHPDGRAFNVCDGIVRASRRERDWSVPRPLRAGEVVPYDIDLAATSMVFLQGHRLQLLITSSDFPRYDRNPGRAVIGHVARELAPARQRIFCDAAHPSHIVLPVVGPAATTP